MACGILIPQSGIEHETPALEVHGLNHWTTREVPWSVILDFWVIEGYRAKAFISSFMILCT